MIKPFQLLIKPVAADCNLECGYCFYRPVNSLFGGDKTVHRMTEDILESIIRDFLGYRFDVSVICWQGGEPTLAGLDFFEKVVELEKQYGRGGQAMGNALQTNGMLIDENWARFLAEYRFLVGLSLDGPEDIHNTYRINRGGKGSFDRVMASADLMKRHGVAFNILTVVSRANQDRAAEVYRFFRKQGFSELQFIPCLELDENGRPAEFSATAEGYARFLADLFEEWIKDDPAAVSIRTFECFLGVAAGRAPDLCIFQDRCGSYLLVEHNGDVYPCDFYVKPEWRLGNISERPLAGFFELRRQRNFSRRKLKFDPSCDGCRWIADCHGGCPKDWMDSEGKSAGKSLYCASYRSFLDKAMPRFADLISGLSPDSGASGAAQMMRKVGRNDPCPCGSGRKYKKCCMP